MDDPALMLQEEASELFKNVDSLLDEFQNNQQNQILLDKLQYGFHSIKVLSTLLALPEAAKLARKVDHALSAIQDNELKTSQEILAITAATYDQIKEDIEAELENTPIDPSPTETLLADWDRFLTPLGVGKSQPSFGEKASDRAHDGARILIVDDEAVSRKLLENIIRKYDAGLEIVSVETAEEGLFYYLTEPFDLVFLDIIMPTIDGNDFIAIVEKNYTLGHINAASNIVVQTAVESMEQLLSYIKKTCVQEVIRKPVTPDRITDCLERFCC